MKELKFLYETTVKRQVEESVVETREEQGQKIEIKRTIKKAKPIKIAVLKPDRKLFKAAEMFYARTLSENLKAGLLPYSLVAKRYANDGGPLTEKEKSRLKELRDESQKLEKEFFALAGNDTSNQDNKNDLLIKINHINAEVSNIQNSYSDIFDSTAEIKARNDTIEWWALFLIYANLDEKAYLPLFTDVDYDARVAKLEDYENEADPFIIEVIKRLSYIISFWFTARDTITQIDFTTMERLYIDTMSDYKVEETPLPEEVKITDKTPAPAPVPAPVSVTTPEPTPAPVPAQESPSVSTPEPVVT